MPADVIDYEIVGDDLQAVVITLDPQEAAVAEAGAMMYMEPDIEMATSMSMTGEEGGLMGKLFKAGKRLVTGESFFITFFANQGMERRDVGFAAPYPGRIIPVELADHGGTIICQKDAFLCGARGIDVDIAFQKRLGVGFFGGEGFILQRITSSDGEGMAFVHACGSVIERRLGPGEVLRVDTGCLVAMEATVDYDIQWVKGIKNKIFGGEGLFYAALRGPGIVWLQTLPFSRMADRIYAAAPQGGGKDKGEGSVLGGVFNVLGGD
ncbi:MAG: TIGR00266 family protein [Planctomycetota bacterium]|nr:TIGR00266 family protein [Planctomycetota bacterium]